MTRTWTASIEVYDPKTRRTTSFGASDSDFDLLRDQTQSAVQEAALLINKDDNFELTVTLWKQTKARGLERDRRFCVYQDKHGVVRYQ